MSQKHAQQRENVSDFPFKITFNVHSQRRGGFGEKDSDCLVLIKPAFRQAFTEKDAHLQNWKPPFEERKQLKIFNYNLVSFISYFWLSTPAELK